MSVASITHKAHKSVRDCRAGDAFLVRGGIQCGNCLGHNVPAPPPGKYCADSASDGPCPLVAEHDGRCWIHHLQRKGAQ